MVFIYNLMTCKHMDKTTIYNLKKNIFQQQCLSSTRITCKPKL